MWVWLTNLDCLLKEHIANYLNTFVNIFYLCTNDDRITYVKTTDFMKYLDKNVTDYYKVTTLHKITFSVRNTRHQQDEKQIRLSSNRSGNCLSKLHLSFISFWNSNYKCPFLCWQYNVGHKLGYWWAAQNLYVWKSQCDAPVFYSYKHVNAEKTLFSDSLKVN